MFSKRDVIEMMYRPVPMPENLLNAVIERAMSYDTITIIEEFRKSTQLNLKLVSNNLFQIIYFE